MSSSILQPLFNDEGLAPGLAEDRTAYRSMLAIRRFEEKLGQLVALGVVSESADFTTGKEAVAAGIAMAAQAGETFVSSTGVYGVLLAKGIPCAALCRSLIGCEDPGAWGRQHGAPLFATDGEALAHAVQLAGTGGVTFCWITAREPGVGLCALVERVADEKLPLICVVDGDAADLSGVGTILFEAERRAIATERVDGVDVRRVAAACRQAAERARRGEGPSFIGARTLRFQGHVASNARMPGEKDRPREDTDPIARARARLLAEGAAGEAELKMLEKDVRDYIGTAASAARSAAERLRGTIQ